MKMKKVLFLVDDYEECCLLVRENVRIAMIRL